MPYPYGGLQRQIQVDLDPDALRAQGLSGNDVTNAFNAQNSILPAGTQKIGDREYFVTVNANPKTVAELNDLPITTRNGSIIYVRDVAHVRDGYPPQTNIVRRDGHRGVLMSVLKTGSASTLDIIKSIKERLPRIRSAAAGRIQHRPGGRPVDLRARRDRRRGARGGDRRGPDRAHDPAVPRQLAQHAHHRHLDPAVDPGLDHLPVGARRDHQHHDPRRAGARGRHPGGRRHGHHREHQLASRAGRGRRGGHPHRRARDRPARPGLHPRHLHRVRADVHAGRHRPLPVRAAGRGGRVRDAGLLRAVANAGADARQVLAAEARPARRAPRPRPPRSACSSASSAASHAPRDGYRGLLERGPGRRPAASRCRSSRPWRSPRCSPSPSAATCRAGTGLLPERGCRADQAAPARPDRHPHR